MEKADFGEWNQSFFNRIGNAAKTGKLRARDRPEAIGYWGNLAVFCRFKSAPALRPVALFFRTGPRCRDFFVLLRRPNNWR